MLKHTQVIKGKMCLSVCETKCLEPSLERLLQLNFKQISCYIDFGKNTGDLEVKTYLYRVELELYFAKELLCAEPF